MGLKVILSVGHLCCWADLCQLGWLGGTLGYGLGCPSKTHPLSGPALFTGLPFPPLKGSHSILLLHFPTPSTGLPQPGLEMDLVPGGQGTSRTQPSQLTTHCFPTYLQHD